MSDVDSRPFAMLPKFESQMPDAKLTSKLEDTDCSTESSDDEEFRVDDDDSDESNSSSTSE